MCILKVSGPEKDFKTCKIIKRLRCRTFFNACITWRSLCDPYGGLLKLAAPGNQGLLAPSKEFNILSEESDGCGKKENRYIYIHIASSSNSTSMMGADPSKRDRGMVVLQLLRC
jgi:hypothetical protein